MTAVPIVIKLGTQVLMDPTTGELATSRLAGFVADCALMHQAGQAVLLVSSGAVGLGRQRLGLKPPLPLEAKQACAAIGQSWLMETYRRQFAEHGIEVAQVLLTAGDFSDRQRYLTLQKVLETLLSFKVVPIINENDVISTQELEESPITKSFGDNDHLSALVAGKLCAQKLVLLTNVDGLYTDNPNTNAQAQRIDTVDNFEALGHVGLKGQSGDGRGGMASKVQAARIAAICGVETYITSGLKSRPLGFLADPTTPFSGTRVLPFAGLASRKQWIGFASGALGRIVVNAGAAKALLQKHASLLPVGIVGTQGQFLAGEVVSIVTESAEELGRGVTSYSAEEVRRIQGLKSQSIAQALGTRAQADLVQAGAEPPHEVIHRDALVIFQELAATSA